MMKSSELVAKVVDIAKHYKTLYVMGVLWCAADRHKQVSVYQEPPLQHGGSSYLYDYGGDP